jgi:hypothetical protein
LDVRHYAIAPITAVPDYCGVWLFNLSDCEAMSTESIVALIALAGAIVGIIRLRQQAQADSLKAQAERDAQEQKHQQDLENQRIANEAARDKADLEQRLYLQKELSNQKTRIDQLTSDMTLHMELRAAAETRASSGESRIEVLEATLKEQNREREKLLKEVTELTVIRDRVIPPLEGMVAYLRGENTSKERENTLLRDREATLLVQIEALEKAIIGMKSQIDALESQVKMLQGVGNANGQNEKQAI